MQFLTALFVDTAFSIVPVLAQQHYDYDDYSFWVAWNSNHHAIFGQIACADFDDPTV